MRPINMKMASQTGRKPFGSFCKFLVWYFCNAFSHHWESRWSWKDSKMISTLLYWLIS